MRKIPIVKAVGSNYKVGIIIGTTLKKQIAQLIKTNREKYGQKLSQYLKSLQLFMQQTQKYFPMYSTELQGIADGARVPFNELFLSNNREVIDASSHLDDQNHCTIVGIPNNSGYLLGHNEDWEKDRYI